MAATRVEKLTPAQQERIAEYRERWLRIGLATGPAHRHAVLEGVRLAYQAANLESPGIAIWLRSPFEGCVGAAMLAHLGKTGLSRKVMAQVGAQVKAQVRAQVMDQVWDQVKAQVGAQVMDQVKAQVWDQVWAQVMNQVGAQVRAQVRAQVMAQVGAQVMDQVGAQVGVQVRDQVRAQVMDQVWDQVKAQVWAQVMNQVGAQVGAQVMAQVGAQVKAQVRAQVMDQVWDQVKAQVGVQVMAQVMDQVGAQVWDQISRAGYGQQDANWLGFYDFFRDVCGLGAVDRLAGLIALAGAGWWWPFRGAVILTERPVFLARDDRNRLHCADRAAIEYPDGWGVYAWHGVRVPRAVICEPIQSAQIDQERNAEIRRVMLERFGSQRYLREGGAECVSRGKDPSGQPIALWRKQMPGDSEPLCMLEVIDATPDPTTGQRKTYMLGVPPAMRTAAEALAWTWGLPVADYRPVKET